MGDESREEMEQIDLAHLWENASRALHYDRIDEAEQAAQKLLDVAPDSTTTWELWGDVLLAKGKLEEAADSFRKAMALESANADAEHKYAQVQLELQEARRQRQALESGDLSQFRGAPRKEPGTAAARSALFPGFGQVYNGEYEKGLVMFVVGLVLVVLAIRLVTEWLSPAQSPSGLTAVLGYLGLFGGIALYVFGIYDAYRGGQQDTDRSVPSPPASPLDKGE